MYGDLEKAFQKEKCSIMGDGGSTDGWKVSEKQRWAGKRGVENVFHVFKFRSQMVIYFECY